MKIFQNSVSNFGIFEDAVKQNIYFGETFTTRETTYSASIHFPEQEIKYQYSMDAQKLSILGKMQRLKGHLNRLPVEVLNQKCVAKDIQYFKFSKDIQDLEKYSGLVQSFENVIEIDISAAYYHSALQMNIIDENLFNELMFQCATKGKGKSKKVVFKKDKKGCLIPRPKTDRLRILGSMAVRTTVTEYENGKVKNIDVVKNDCFRNLWFLICKKVDDVFKQILTLIPAKDFLFYFVDGIYVRNTVETVSTIKNIFESNNFPFKEVLIDSFQVVNKNQRLIIEIKKQNGKEKKFFVPHRSVKHYIID